MIYPCTFLSISIESYSYWGGHKKHWFIQLSFVSDSSHATVSQIPFIGPRDVLELYAFMFDQHVYHMTLKSIHVHTLGSTWDFWHTTHYVFKCIFLRESVCISPKFPYEGPINNIPLLLSANRRHHLSQPIKPQLMVHIYVIRPRWVGYIPT